MPLLLTSSLAVASPAAAQTASTFGFDTMRAADGSRASGTRDLLVIVLDVDGFDTIPRSTAYYRALFFGGATPNVAAFYTEISNGNFTWREAGTLRLRSPTASMTIEQRCADAIRLAHASGFDFAAYDRDGDGVVRDSELTLAVLTPGGNGQSDYGAERRSDPAQVTLQGTTVAVNTATALLFHSTSFRVITHELLHTLGAEDTYSNDPDRHSERLNLMSACACGNAYEMATVHPDPWHKMMLGWIEPSVYDVRQAGSALIAVAQAYPFPSLMAPVLLYDPSKGTGEYYLLEYRNPARGGNDSLAAGKGLVPWYVRRGQNRIPGSTRMMAQVIAAGAPGAGSTAVFGGNQPWQPRHGSFGLHIGSGVIGRAAATTYNPDWSFIQVRWGNLTPGLTLFGDVNGDGRADGVAINAGDVWVSLAKTDGTGFGAPFRGLSGAIYGTRGTFVARVDSDVYADIVAVNDDSVWVARGTPSGSFQWPVAWQWAASYGTYATAVEDVTGDGKADIVAVSDGGIAVSQSMGTYFAAPVSRMPGAIWGTRGTYVADVNDDTRADVVAVNDGDVWVSYAQPSGSFTSPTWYAGAPSIGTEGTFVADLDGDRKADLIAVDRNGIPAQRSTGATLQGESRALNGAFYGSRTTAFAVVTGVGVEGIAVNDNDIWMVRSNGFAYDAPAQAMSGAFYGSP